MLKIFFFPFSFIFWQIYFIDFNFSIILYIIKPHVFQLSLDSKTK